MSSAHRGGETTSMEYGAYLIAFGAMGAFLMAFSNGANDVANAFASAVGSKAITMRTAICIAGVVTLAGAVLLGGRVAVKIVSGVVDPELFQTGEYVAAMYAVLLASGIFVLFSTMSGMPVSSSHAIIGSLTGVSIFVAGWGAIRWSAITLILMSWILSPVLAGILSGGLILFFRKAVIGPGGPGTLARVKRKLPIIIGATASAGFLGLVEGTALKDLLPLERTQIVAIALLISVPVFLVAKAALHEWLKHAEDDEHGAQAAFRSPQLGTSCYVAFSIGANDVANSISPVFAICLVVQNHGIPKEFTGTVPFWILFLGGIGMAAGIGLLGSKVMRTLGEKLTKINNSSGFSIDFSVATTVIGASILGIPVSTTHAATGAVIGAGFSGREKVDLTMMGKIMLTWLITLPVAAMTTICIYFMIAQFFMHLHM